MSENLGAPALEIAVPVARRVATLANADERHDFESFMNPHRPSPNRSEAMKQTSPRSTRLSPWFLGGCPHLRDDATTNHLFR
jgi:hypothetical protein